MKDCEIKSFQYLNVLEEVIHVQNVRIEIQIKWQAAILFNHITLENGNVSKFNVKIKGTSYS